MKKATQTTRSFVNSRETKFDKFKPYEDEEHQNDIDVLHSVRTFSGKMTKLRWKILNRFARTRTVSSFGGCGHQWDCCGCLCSQHVSVSYKHNKVKIIFTQHFNY